MAVLRYLKDSRTTYNIFTRRLLQYNSDLDITQLQEVASLSPATRTLLLKCGILNCTALKTLVVAFEHVWLTEAARCTW